MRFPSFIHKQMIILYFVVLVIITLSYSLCKIACTKYAPAMPCLSKRKNDPRMTSAELVLDFTSSRKDSTYKIFTKEEILGNITKKDGAIFSYFQNDDYIENDWEQYRSRPPVHNDFSNSFLINGKDVCLRDDPYVIVIIPSMVNETAHRNLIRSTWLRAAETFTWPHGIIPDRIRHIFLCGRAQNDTSKNASHERLLSESILHNDIVMVDLEDTYRNLTIKIILGLRWVLQFCARARLVLKVDMDTVINAPLLLHLLKIVGAEVKTEKFVLGLQQVYVKPAVERNGAWRVSLEEYPIRFFPKYVYGHVYAISRDSVSLLVETAKRVRLFAVEDAFITGILPKLAGITRLSAESFPVTLKANELYDCEIVWNKKVAVTDIKCNMLEWLWRKLVTTECERVRNITVEPQRTLSWN